MATNRSIFTPSGIIARLLFRYAHKGKTAERKLQLAGTYGIVDTFGIIRGLQLSIRVYQQHHITETELTVNDHHTSSTSEEKSPLSRVQDGNGNNGNEKADNGRMSQL